MAPFVPIVFHRLLRHAMFACPRAPRILRSPDPSRQPLPGRRGIDPSRPSVMPRSPVLTLARLERAAILLALVLVSAAAPRSAVAQARPAITPADYGPWEGLGAATLSPDGRWLAHVITRVNEENELRIRALARDTTFVVPNGSGAAFGANSRWIAYTIGVSPATRERLERERKPVRNALGLRDLTTGRTDSVPEIATFRLSPDGRYVAMRRYPAEGKRAADLLVQDLATGARMTFGSVGEFAWSERRALLALTFDTEGGTGNAVQLYDPATGVVRVLDSSPSLYRGLAWREASEDLAVLRTIADKAFRDTTHVVLRWTNAAAATAVRRELDPASATGFPPGNRIAEHRTPQWSKDGTALYIGLRPREAAGTDSTSGRGGGAARAEKISDVQVWHSKDVRIMPMQKVQERQDLQRTVLAAWHVNDARVVPLATDPLETARVLEGGRYATETDRKPHAWGTMFGRPYQDIWLTDVRTGERRRILEKVRHFYGGSPSGRKLAWYDGKHYWSIDITSGARTNLSERAAADFSNPDWDYPGDMVPPAGFAGWTRDERAVLVYDEFDAWSLAADGSGGRRLTDGRRESVVHRLVRIGSDSEEGIDLSRPLYFSLAGKRTKQTGYARLVPGRAPERLVLADARVFRLTRADSAEVFAYTQERFDDSPDWFVGGPLLRDARQVTATNAFQANHAWGRAELVDFSSATDRPLQAVLYYPANYEPSRKYPMIVYTYERLSQNLHNYVIPSERSYYNFASWTANGYFVLTPDIVFRGRDPGLSVLESVEPAVRTIVQRGIVDSARVGHVGHSWGGYEATFLPTRTHIFAATVAGAPITNFLSFAGAIHWTPGIAEFDHWETGQARMDVPYWEDLDAYLRNSPAAKVHELRTPILMEVGDADGTVDWHQGIEFYNFARRAGRKDFVLLVYPGEDHGLRKKENQIDYHRRIQEWFGHYLKGEPAPRWMSEGMTWLERKTRLDGQR